MRRLIGSPYFTAPRSGRGGNGGRRQTVPVAETSFPGRLARVSKKTHSIESPALGTNESVRVQAQSGWSGCEYDFVRVTRPSAERASADGTGELPPQRTGSSFAVSMSSVESQMDLPPTLPAQSSLLPKADSAITQMDTTANWHMALLIRAPPQNSNPLRMKGRIRAFAASLSNRCWLEFHARMPGTRWDITPTSTLSMIGIEASTSLKQRECVSS